MRRAIADSRLAVTLRRLRRRFGISAPRMAVRTHIPWYWRATAAVVVLTLSLALAGWVYDAGRRIAGFYQRETEQELAGLRDQAIELEREAARLRSFANSSESSLQIERATQQQLVRQIKMLQEENGRLKEDIAFFESLAAAEGKAPALSIRRLRVEPDVVPGQYRFRLLAVAQGGKKDLEVRGSVQFLVGLQQDGRSAMMVLPAANDPNPQRYNVSFRYFRRVEGTFQVPMGAYVTSVEVRLVQDGVMRATQRVTL